jgi:hypothetical protein
MIKRTSDPVLETRFITLHSFAFYSFFRVHVVPFSASLFGALSALYITLFLKFDFVHENEIELQ